MGAPSASNSPSALSAQALREARTLENGLIPRKMVVDCPLATTSIGDTLFQTRPGMRNNWPIQSFAWLTLGLVLYWYGIYWHYVYEMNLNTFVSELLFAGWLESGTRSMFGMIRFHGKGGRKKDSVRKEQNGLSSLQQSVYHN